MRHSTRMLVALFLLFSASSQAYGEPLKSNLNLTFEHFKLAGLQLHKLQIQLEKMEYDPANSQPQGQIRREISQHRATLFRSLETLFSEPNAVPNLKCQIHASLDKSHGILFLDLSDSHKIAHYQYTIKHVKDFITLKSSDSFNGEEIYILFIGNFRQYVETIVFNSSGQVLMVNLNNLFPIENSNEIGVSSLHCGDDEFTLFSTPQNI